MVTIHRLGAKRKQTSFTGRAWHYWRFYFLTLWMLIRTRPFVVLYFESVSAFPAYVYKRYIHRKSKLFIHYHEYMTPREYEGGMWLVKWFHKLEKKIYGKAGWISHTNAARMERFAGDMKGVALPERLIFPNYPPRSWGREEKRWDRAEKPWGRDAEGAAAGELKTVYIGAFSLETMYVKEFAGWVVAQGGAVSWDIYSLNITPEARAYIGSLPGDWVKIHPGIDYNDLPEILAKYDVGLILYTGHVPNWVDNAPNKLFEYWSVGLDVWLPHKMTGSLSYVTATTYPRVVAVDFQRLEYFDWRAAVDRSGLEYAASPYCCEDVYRRLWKLLSEQ
ncbi:MAG TPA: hypothetical protein VL978_15275 [Puia sp.]|nr:hypothetical protein [Puia sp.]